MVIGETVSRYRIVEKLGAGGMGEVYRAEDTRLAREVAVKVLPPQFASSPEHRARFELEAQAVAALSHPNVLAIHDFGIEGDVAFAVMELLKGETLRSEIDRLGALPLSYALDHAIQAARGLAAAHDKGIVHRDLKPANLFITTGGQLKILDFGLAKTVAPGLEDSSEQVTVAARTQPGMILGTFAYMSPEQVKGLPVGASADLFALGVILYEMLSGQNPFRRDSAAETMSAVLRDGVTPLDQVMLDLPSEVAHIVRHCLEKSPADRAHSAQDLILRLEACRGALKTSPALGPAPQTIDSLAVLPFLNESGDPDADYLSDGITDTIIDNLSQLPRLRVMARSTVFQYRQPDAAPQEVGAALGVRAVLTGRLLHRRETLVVRAELVDATDGRRLWGGRFDRASTDLLEIEDEISREITEKLRFQLSPEEKNRIARRHTDHPEAHAAYLQGRHVWNRWKTPEGMRTAIGFFERALELDPLYARAFAGLADSYSMLGNIKALAPGEAYPRAKTAAQQGLAIDDGLAELHTSLAFIHRHWDWDWAAAEREYRRAIELNPGYAMAHRWFGHLLAGLGRHEQSIAESKLSLDLEPLSLIIRGALGDSLFYAHRYDEAIEYYRQTIEMDPQFLAGHTDLARALELAGRYQEAIEEFRTAEALAPKGPPEPCSGLAHVYAQMGRRDEALAIVEELKQMSKRRYVSPYGIASIYACLGETETALDWLDKAYAEHDQTLVWVKVHPRLDRLRSHPRYQNLLRRMKLS